MNTLPVSGRALASSDTSGMSLYTSPTDCISVLLSQYYISIVQKGKRPKLVILE